MSDTGKNIAAVILAAGMGTRMKSDNAKVLHQLNGRSMILYVIDSVRKLAGENLIIVIGHQAETVRKEVSKNVDDVFRMLHKPIGRLVITVIPSRSCRGASPRVFNHRGRRGERKRISMTSI